MIKVLINNEEVVSNHNLEIKEEMLSTSSTILKNCYPKVWENDKDYVSRYYYPKDYSKCKIYNLPRENTIQEQTGTNLSFETYVGKSTLEDIKFYGNTQQTGTPTPDTPVEIQNVTGLQNVGVCGKNLIPFTNQDFTLKNVRYYIQNGNLYFDGTSTGETYSTNQQFKDNFNFYLDAGTYTLSAKYLDPGRPFYIKKYSDNSQIAVVNTKTRPKETFTLSERTQVYLAFYMYQATFSEYNTELMLEKGNTQTTYEPYKGNTYKVNLGKNLLNLTNGTYSSNGIDYIVNNGEITINGTATGYSTVSIPITSIDVNGTTTMSLSNISGTITDASSTNTCYIQLISGNSSVKEIKPKYSQVNTATRTSKTIVSVLRLSCSKNVKCENYKFNIQLEKGTQATSYSPYFTPIELNKIGDYQDKIYKENGKWYIEKQIGKVVLDGSKTYNKYSGLDSANYNCFYTIISNMLVETTGAINIVLSNCFLGETFNDRNKDIANMWGNKFASQLFFKVPNTIITTSDLQTWLSTHNTEVYYVLATPTYTEITNEELINQLESLNIQLYENKTNFIISGSLPMPTYIKIYTNFEELIFCGFTKNTGNVSLNPRQFHGVDLQILDFKDLLSTGETLNYVIANKTITEAINQVVNSISDYGFVVGEIQLLNPDEIIGAYSTLNKTAYDVFQYIADITQSRWTTRLIDENTIAIDFYDPSLMPTGVDIDKTQTFYENYKIIDMSFNYSTNDYRNKQIMTSDEVYANITQTETIIADGYATSFMCQNKIGLITSITLNGVEKTFATKSEEQLGITADFVYQPGETTFTSNDPIGAGGVIVITYYPIVKGREIILNNTESDRIESQINRNGTISRYENRNDTTSSQELQKIGQSYIKYKGNAEINLKIVSELNTWNVGEIVSYNAPISELSTTYMVKSKQISMYLNANKIIYTYNLTSNYNCENAVNYFDNQRAKNQGNIGEGETITRNIDLTNDALILFYDTNVEEIQAQNSTSLDFALDGVLI